MNCLQETTVYEYIHSYTLIIDYLHM